MYGDSQSQRAIALSRLKVRFMSIKVLILRVEKLAIGKKTNDVLSLIARSEPDEKLFVFDS